MGSCPNLLRPACPYTGCRLSSFAGSVPHGVYSCQLRLLFFIIYRLLPALHLLSWRWLSQWMLTPCSDLCRFSCRCRFLQRHHERVSIPEPWQIPALAADARQDPGIMCMVLPSVVLLCLFMPLRLSHLPDALCPSSFLPDRTPCRFSRLRR